jgi:CelD/BcsL family acetyltransferase involved in cellulose biosynthesis
MRQILGQQPMKESMKQTETVIPTLDEIAQPPHPGAERRVPCDVTAVRTDAGFDALEAEWSELVAEAPVSVFQTFEWLRTWWTHFGPGRDLWILLFRHDERLVGIAPMFKDRGRILGIPTVRHAQFIGCGLSDYTDMIIRPGYERSVLESFASHLASAPEEWDLLDLEDVNERTCAARLLPEILRERQLAVYQYQGNVCPYVELPEKADDLMQELGPTARYNVRRKLKHLQSQFKTEVELYRTEEDDLEKAVADFSFIHGERWKSLGFPSAFDDERHRAFHIAVAKGFAKRDWLRMFFLNADDQPVAVSFCFNYRGRIYMYQSNAHGSDAVMKCSPGFLVRSMAMMEGIGEGMRVYDFLRGDEEYKYREWGAVDSQNWLIRTRSPLTASYARFLVFLARELAGKMAKRAAREYYELKRMRIVKRPTPAMLVNYVVTKVFHLVRLGAEFIVRHSPLGAQTAPEKDPASGRGSYQALQDIDGSAVLEYTLGEKILRTLRSLKINNVLHAARTRLREQTVLEEHASAISATVKVTESGPERLLLLDGKAHALFDTSGRWKEAKREYWGAMSESPFGIPDHPRVLACGLGGGTTLHLLLAKHRPSAVTALEADPVVVAMARKHLALDAIPGLTVIEGDVASSIHRLRSQGAAYDLILDDVFDKVTGKLSRHHQSLVKSLMGMLAEGGTLTFQRPIDTSGDARQSVRFAQSLRDMGYIVQARKIRHRWLNDIIYCKATKA